MLLAALAHVILSDVTAPSVLSTHVYVVEHVPAAHQASDDCLEHSPHSKKLCVMEYSVSSVQTSIFVLTGRKRLIIENKDFLIVSHCRIQL